MTYKKAIEQAVMAHKLDDRVNDEIVKKISAEYRWSEQKVRKDIEAAMFSEFSTYEEKNG